MLVLITYDVNTEDSAGKKTIATDCQTMCQLRTARSVFRV